MRSASLSLLLAFTSLALVGCGDKDEDDDGSGGVDDTGGADCVPSDEICDGEDNDCDGEIDEDDAVDQLTGYADADGDGYGDAAASVTACSLPDDVVDNADDCDDTAADVNPAADEVCDGIDNDCDAVVDPDDAIDAAVWYADTDGDGYGDVDTTGAACEAPSDTTDNADDCDDADALVSPDAEEVCDGIDNNCDGAVDEDTAVDAVTWYLDDDSDGLGDADSTYVSCEVPSGYVDNADDCDDAEALVLECCTDGGDGDWIASTDTTVDGGVLFLDSFTIDPGVTVTVTGDAPLVVYARSVDIQGTLDASGSDGTDSGSTSVPDGGDAGAGGGGGGGGSDCGNGSGAGGLPNGVASASGYVEGGAGGLPWGLYTDDHDAPTGGGFGPGGGGGGGGAAAAGSDGDRADSSDGVGGSTFGDATLEPVFTGGMGGAGGGANGGGGGGGGGAVALFANTISVTGTVDVTGGDGGGKLDGSCTSGGGGGGGGGMIWLQADIVDVSGALDASGGAGAVVDSSANLNAAGGDGADGRVRIGGASLSTTGTVLPAIGATDSDYPECDAGGDSIYDVQGGVFTEGDEVDVRGLVVTGVTDYGFFAQDAAGGEYSGAWVYTGGDREIWLEPGDEVDVLGEYLEYQDLTEIDVSDGWVRFVGTGTALTPEVVSLADLADPATAEPWEGVLVEVETVTVVDPDLGYGEWSVGDGTDEVMLDDLIYDQADDFTLGAADTFTSVAGVLNYTFGDFKIVPRDVDDLQGYVDN